MLFPMAATLGGALSARGGTGRTTDIQTWVVACKVPGARR